MKKIVKSIIVILCVLIIVLCAIKLVHNPEDKPEMAHEDKGTYSYYFEAPTIPNESSHEDIYFFSK